MRASVVELTSDSKTLLTSTCSLATSMQASVVGLRSGSETSLISMYSVIRLVSNLCVEAELYREVTFHVPTLVALQGKDWNRFRKSIQLDSPGLRSAVTARQVSRFFKLAGLTQAAALDRNYSEESYELVSESQHAKVAEAEFARGFASDGTLSSIVRFGRWL